eukprot:gene3180-2162_t
MIYCLLCFLLVFGYCIECVPYLCVAIHAVGGLHSYCCYDLVDVLKLDSISSITCLCCVVVHTVAATLIHGWNVSLLFSARYLDLLVYGVLLIVIKCMYRFCGCCYLNDFVGVGCELRKLDFDLFGIIVLGEGLRVGLKLSVMGFLFLHADDVGYRVYNIEFNDQFVIALLCSFIIFVITCGWCDVSLIDDVWVAVWFIVIGYSLLQLISVVYFVFDLRVVSVLLILFVFACLTAGRVATFKLLDSPWWICVIMLWLYFRKCVFL